MIEGSLPSKPWTKTPLSLLRPTSGCQPVEPDHQPRALPGRHHVQPSGAQQHHQAAERAN
jgi:hypothetical protein